MIYKFNLISTLIFRSYTISSNWSLIHEEVLKLKSILQRNSYPLHIIDRLFSRFLHKMKCSRTVNTPQESSKKTIQVILPFLGSTSRKLEKAIRVLIEQNTTKLKIQVIYHATARISSLFKFKDSVPSYLSSRVVYKFKCSRCNSTYVGKTKHHTKTRYAKHLGISALTGKNVRVFDPTNVTNHITSCKCNATYDNFSILCRDSSYSDLILRTKESLFIHLHKPNLNGQKSSIPLQLFTS